MSQDAQSEDQAAHRHLRMGWWSLVVFVSLGVVLETLHGFKEQWYLGLQHETRRHLWTLAHAHGTLLGLVHIAVASTIRAKQGWSPQQIRAIWGCVTGAGILLPLGFFLGGIGAMGGDPGVFILLVPPGAALLIIGSLMIARGLGSNER